MNRPLPSPSRRTLLRGLGAAGLAGLGGAPWLAGLAAHGSARAADSSGYKALVCLFQYGGNDAYNTVLATEAASWARYVAARNASDDPVALPAPGTPPAAGGNSFNAALGGVLPIVPARTQGRTFALHPSLGAVRDLFAANRLAVVSNVGPMIGPTPKAAYLAGTAALPPKLFSHNDQQSCWQSMGPEGTAVGWGGLMSDRCSGANAHPLFTAVDLSGSAVWLSGQQVQGYQLGLDGAIHLGGAGGVLFGSADAQAALVEIMRSTRADTVVQQDHAAVVGRSVDGEAVLAPAMPPAAQAPWGTPGWPDDGTTDPLLTFVAPSNGQSQPNPIALQLQPIARMIAARAALGMSRQVFFVGIQGGDTHDDQNERHADLMAQLAHGLSYWDTVTRAMGVDGQVTTFTAADFGRCFSANGTGTDHGWGGHHFVMGGAVHGGDVYGRFPAYGDPDGSGGFTSDDQLTDGALLPVASVDQYAATLGRWFGLSDAELLQVLPNLANWDAASRDLGFMG